MIDITSAISIVMKNNPDKKINGNPGEYKGKYVFDLVSKDYVEGMPNWDARIFTVDKITGEIDHFNAFEDPDFLFEAKPILSY